MRGVYVVTVEAVPAPDSERFATYAGAFINVYVRTSSSDEAIAAATQEVAEAGWVCRSIDEAAFLTREDLCDSPEGSSHFDQAMLDGVVVVIHSFPIAAPDREETEH